MVTKNKNAAGNSEETPTTEEIREYIKKQFNHIFKKAKLSENELRRVFQMTAAFFKKNLGIGKKNILTPSYIAEEFYSSVI